MVATDISVIGHEMSVPQAKAVALPETEGVFVVRFTSHDADIRAMRAMGRIDRVFTNERGDNYINRRQLEELQRLEIPYKVVTAPPSYKPSAPKTLRR